MALPALPRLAHALRRLGSVLRRLRVLPARPPLAAGQPSPPPCPRPTADALGRRGERVAVRALRRAGYRILARRWKTRSGEEVDVVALHGATVVVVEVKSTASATARPSDRVDHRKRERLRRAAAALLRGPPGVARPVRIDVVVVRFDGRRGRAEIRPGHARLS